ncbi:hypothetical protein RBH94_06985 [Aestuariibaculum sp. YM273]|uniref:hypothetical protein n=1 Tax=Aestuariibaculum sp. YM273 TaxID=3070659 RepID=UPI0027DB8571|nr:hypothetical protein [Aestuariibaculum sp. YM273]WMI66897.1 hypothetical protein RBH94_06985 [Aestuariibaculum sp. YM273]
MKYLIIIIFLLVFTSIITGLVIDTSYSQKLIGFGVMGLFFVAFPLFAYYRWKDKNIKDYMITKENLEEMRKSQEKKKY